MPKHRNSQEQCSWRCGPAVHCTAYEDMRLRELASHLCQVTSLLVCNSDKTNSKVELLKPVSIYKTNVLSFNRSWNSVWKIIKLYKEIQNTNDVVKIFSLAETMMW